MKYQLLKPLFLFPKGAILDVNFEDRIVKVGEYQLPPEMANVIIFMITESRQGKELFRLLPIKNETKQKHS